MYTIIVTGCTGAVGSAAVRILHEKGHIVIGTTRREPRESERSLDLGSIASIVAFVDKLKTDGIKVDCLLNNAGTMERHFELNDDGFERVIGTNYIGTYLLSRLMIKAMGTGLRIVNTVSLTCYTARFDKNFFNVDEHKYSQLGTYANSKYAVMLFSQELARRTCNPVNMTDPGIVNSRMLHMDRWFDPIADLLFRPFCKSAESGAKPAVLAATTDCFMQLFRGSKHMEIPQRWNKPELAAWLYDETERILKEKGIEL
ncbi:MAG: SDR family NAD(P)-dependent oxidoreductase [Bacteroidales bacterium]|nr:SDR family NAD(P)-dependent oxidoreductase [Bacteroidales bacterium]